MLVLSGHVMKSTYPKKLCVLQCLLTLCLLMLILEACFIQQFMICSESLLDYLNQVSTDSSVRFILKASLDGSRSHYKRHQLLDDSVDDSLTGSSDSLLGVFMAPLALHLDENDSSILLWSDPSPNSIFYKANTPCQGEGV